MAYGDNYYPTGGAASRPPQGAGENRTNAQQGTAPGAPSARVRPSGRPAAYGQGSSYGQPSAQRSPYGQPARQGSPYGQSGAQSYPARQPYPTRPTSQRYPTRSEDPFAAEKAQIQARQNGYSANGYSAGNTTPAYKGSTPTYTEISWDSFQRGLNGGKAPAGQRQANPYPSGNPSPTQPRTQTGAPQTPGRGQNPAAQTGPRTGNRSPESAQRPSGYTPSYAQPNREAAYRRDLNPRAAGGAYTRSSDADLFAGGYAQPEEPADTRRTPPRPQVPKWKKMHPLVYAIAGVALLLIVIIVAKLIGSGKNKQQETYQRPTDTTVSTAVPEYTTPDPGEGTASTEATPETTPAPTPVPTATPSGPKAQLADGKVVPADWGVAIPARTEAVYDSFFDNSVMIGNSLVEGFFMWSGLTNCRYIYNTGAVVSNVIGVMDLSPITLNEKDYYNNIYLMFGLNEVGSDVNSFVQSYIKLINYLREYHPSANIIIVSVTPVTKDVDADPNEVQTMERIRNFNSALKSLCEDQDCWYLDIYSLLVDSEGYLSADYAYAGDGKHFEKSGYVAWANYMKNHYVDEKLPTE